MKKIFISIITILIFANLDLNAQGCVAIRGTNAVCTRAHAEKEQQKVWQFSTTYRYFKSHRHFVGTEEQHEREEQNTEVINWTNIIDFGLIRQLNNRMSLGLYIPVISNVRSSLYEHMGNSAGPKGRHETKSFGIGDMRLAAYRWMLDPVKSMKGNIQLGLGIKLPTGDYQYQDYFVKSDSVKVLGPVDQSIQLGDGGTGFTLELNGYYNFSQKVGVYGNFYYLLNPREQNGTSTARGGVPNATAIQYSTSVMSVPDQFMVRGGGNVMLNRWSFSAGVRYECLPSEDLVGGSLGFRRPGYILSGEPGVTYGTRKVTVYGSVPFALKRNRTQSVADKMRTEKTGVYTHGDAAFADYTINLGAIFTF